jgi:hypothetical protein
MKPPVVSLAHSSFKTSCRYRLHVERHVPDIEPQAHVEFRTVNCKT